MRSASSDLDTTLAALASPVRRTILERLSKGDARVTEVAAPFSTSLNAISKHILVLERAKLVRRRRVGRDHFLSLDPKPFDHALQWMAAQGALWKKRLHLLDELLQEEAREAKPSRRS
ncbi:MAG TPA: metalloregulator ArsR/SmtB family transcription factor [Candidatus Synoicihabitans sp.]|nr:metalloregulator ArsR/SmtB family transcription factor [Candidatus Synoicihabitans sp.]